MSFLFFVFSPFGFFFFFKLKFCFCFLNWLAIELIYEVCLFSKERVSCDFVEALSENAHVLVSVSKSR